MLKRPTGLRGTPGFAWPEEPGGVAAVGGRMLVGAERCSVGLRNVLAADGWLRLTRLQLLIFAALPPWGASPTALAERLEVSRQAVHRQGRGLLDDGLLVADPDPWHRNGTCLRLTPRGAELVTAARQVLLAFDEEHRAFLWPG